MNQGDLKMFLQELPAETRERGGNNEFHVIFYIVLIFGCQYAHREVFKYFLWHLQEILSQLETHSMREEHTS